MDLYRLGWTEPLEQRFTPWRADGLVPARVVREDRERYRAAAAKSARRRFPDVSATPRDGAAISLRLVIGSRCVPGRTMVPCSSARSCRARAPSSGTLPSDLLADQAGVLAAVEAVAPGVPVVALSARDHQGLEALEPWLRPGLSVALLGSSGVGKSMLVNALTGAGRQSTAPVRDDDSRGRHTTTHRELIVLPGGAILIDTPGMRELQLWAGDAALGRTFPEILTLAGLCRFADCAPENEPGCAVLAAAAAGTLPAERLRSWRKLQRELLWVEGKQDERVRQEEQARWKILHKALRDHPKYKSRRDPRR